MQLQNLTDTDIYLRDLNMFQHLKRNIYRYRIGDLLGIGITRPWYTRTGAILLPISVNMAVALGMNLD